MKISLTPPVLVMFTGASFLILFNAFPQIIQTFDATQSQAPEASLHINHEAQKAEERMLVSTSRYLPACGYLGWSAQLNNYVKVSGK